MILYYETDERKLDLIKELWEELKVLHKLKSKYFFQDYESMIFEDRKEELLQKSKNGILRLDLAVDSVSDNIVGYSVTSIVDEKGEIDSIFVEEKYRSRGIGTNLMKRSLNWMDIEGTKNKEVKLSVGNDDTIQFYSQHGFHPKHIVLKQNEEF